MAAARLLAQLLVQRIAAAIVAVPVDVEAQFGQAAQRRAQSRGGPSRYSSRMASLVWEEQAPFAQDAGVIDEHGDDLLLFHGAATLIHHVADVGRVAEAAASGMPSKSASRVTMGIPRSPTIRRYLGIVKGWSSIVLGTPSPSESRVRPTRSTGKPGGSVGFAIPAVDHAIAIAVFVEAGQAAGDAAERIVRQQAIAAEVVITR